MVELTIRSPVATRRRGYSSSAAAATSPSPARPNAMSSRKLEISSSWHVSELHVGGASFCATDGFVNQHRAMRGLTQAAEAAGVTIECGIDVTGMDVKAGRIEALRTTDGIISTDLVVNCAGAWAASLAEQIGVTLPIKGRRVQLLRARPTSAANRSAVAD